jgi:hypothetical protein
VIATQCAAPARKTAGRVDCAAERKAAEESKMQPFEVAIVLALIETWGS